ncbi:helix-turn-helix domain-containing protein [Pseudoalteromonas maricaloris]|uniref:helix-turn-helix domain-containing protein n=1 Tax=Pseudoalteromonas maricaloris TaxID=184924 RepID=UPI003C178ACB
MQHSKFSFHRELGGLEVLHNIDKQEDFGRHSHSGYTLALVDSGAQRFYRSGGEHLASQHSVILINAEQVHDCRKASKDKSSYRSLYPTPELFNQFLGDGKAMAPFFHDAVVHDRALAALMNTTFNVLECDTSVLEKQSQLITLLSYLSNKQGKVTFDTKTPSVKQRITTARHFLLDNLFEDVSLDSLANLVGMSPFYFIRVFKAHTGLTPHAFQIQHRLNHAKALLRSGKSVSHAALSVGFYDQSHFNRHFKKNMGITPSQYSKAC